MKPKILLCLALVLSGVLVGFVSNVRADELATNAEPRYLDKSLSEWIPLARLSGEVNIPLDARAFDALRDIGTNALPWLLRWIQSDKPETARLGLEGLGLLGPIAKPGIPELVRLVNDWPSSSAWSNAIPALAAIRDTNYIPYALPFLLSAATNTDAPAEFRVQALQSIYTPNAGPFLLTGATNTDGSAAYWLQALQSIFYQPIQPIAASASTKAALSVFVACLQDKDWRVAAKAADGLDFGVSTIDPVVAVPALAACLASHTNRPVGSTAGKVENDPAN